MQTHDPSTHPVRTSTSPKVTARVLLTMALLSAACSDTSINSAPLFSNAGNGLSAAANNFAVLANQAVTCTDGTIVGDVGTYQSAPTGSFTQTSCPVTGSIHIGDGVAKQAYEGFLADYAALAPQASDVCPIVTGTLAGVTFTPGTYCISAEAKTGVLTLDGNGTYLFKVAPGAFTGTNFSVVLINGAEPCDITWWVDAAATMTDSDLKGTILAGAAITLTRGTFTGSAYSQADVTITGTAVVGCEGRRGGNPEQDKGKCNQGVGNGPEGCDPGNSNNRRTSNDEDGGTRGNPGRKGAK